MDYNPRGHKESDMTERLSFHPYVIAVVYLCHIFRFTGSEGSSLIPPGKLRPREKGGQKRDKTEREKRKKEGRRG